MSVATLSTVPVDSSSEKLQAPEQSLSSISGEPITSAAAEAAGSAGTPASAGPALRPGGGSGPGGPFSLRPGGGPQGGLSLRPLRARVGGPSPSGLEGAFGGSASSKSGPHIRYGREQLLRLREVWTELPPELQVLAQQSPEDAQVLLSDPTTGDRARAEASSAASESVPAPKQQGEGGRDWRASRGQTDSSSQPPAAPAPRSVAASGAGGGVKEAAVAAAATVPLASTAVSGAQTQPPPQQQQRPDSSQEKGGASKPQGGGAPVIVRSANPWMPRRGAVDDREKVVRTVKGILNKLTPEKFDLLLEQMLSAGINSAATLGDVIALVFDKAVLEPTFCPMYAELCVKLSAALPEFPSEEAAVEGGGRKAAGAPVTFRRVLLNTCQEEFEGAKRLRLAAADSPAQERADMERRLRMRTQGNIRLIGELFLQRMIPEKIVHACVSELLAEGGAEPAEENVEALCQLLTTVGRSLDEKCKAPALMESYMRTLKAFSASPRLSSRIRFMCRDVVDLRANKWVPRRQELRAKKITEIHAEAEANMGLRRGSVTAGLRMSGAAASGLPGVGVPTSGLPGLGGMAPDLDGWETVSVGRKPRRDASAAGRAASTTPIPVPGFPGGSSIGLGSFAAPPGPLAPTGVRVPGAKLAPLPGLPGAALAPGMAPPPAFLSRPSALLSVPGSEPPPSATSVRGAPEPASAPGAKEVTPPGAAAAGGVSAAADSKPAAAGSAGGKKKWGPDEQKRAEMLLSEFATARDLPDAMLNARELGTVDSPDVARGFAELAMRSAVEAVKEAERAAAWDLLAFLAAKGAIAGDALAQTVLALARDLEDWSLDAPNAPRYLGDGIAVLVAGKALPLGPTLVGVSEAAGDVFSRADLLARCLRGLKGQEGKLGGSLKELLQREGVTVQRLAQGPRGDGEVGLTEDVKATMESSLKREGLGVECLEWGA